MFSRVQTATLSESQTGDISKHTAQNDSESILSHTLVEMRGLTHIPPHNPPTTLQIDSEHMVDPAKGYSVETLSETAQNASQGHNPVILTRKARPKSSYLCDPLKGVVDGSDSLLIPLVIDTEFWEPSFPAVVSGVPFTGRRGVTVQICGAFEGTPAVIFAHPHQAQYAQETNRVIRHRVYHSGYAPVDYLQYLGYEASIARYNNDTLIHGMLSADYMDSLPKVQFVTYAFFALAELYMMVQDDFIQDVDDLVHNKFLTMQRRLATNDGRPNYPQDACRMPWILTLEGHEYGVEWCFVDAYAIHGKGGYKEVCANAGIHLEDKDSMKDLKLIDKMHEAYFSHPDEFDRYSLGDLRVYDALRGNAENFRQIWRSLGVEAYYSGQPELTIGASINKLLQAKVYHQFDIAPSDKQTREDMYEKYCTPSSAEHLRARIDSTTALLSKVEGGRCRNNRPTVAHLEGVLVDLDLKGCYGEGQRNQPYPFGRPVIIEYPAESPQNKYRTLRQFLRTMHWHRPDCELVPGLWHARVSLAPNYRLKYAQDFLASWFGFRIKDMHQKPFNEKIADLEDPLLELDVRTGSLKVFTHDIQNAVIGHDFIQWLEHVASEHQRDELLDKLQVHAAMVFPASQRVKSLEQLNERVTNHKGQNECIVRIEKGLLTKINRVQECHAWYAVNLGEFLVNALLAYRSLYKKKTPLNEMYKLAVNTLYGDLVSPFFKTSNTTVGNNITARARAACWYMEKGLYALQSITDGGVFDLNQVLYPADTRRVTSQSVIGMHNATNLPQQRKILLAPLGGYDSITLAWEDKTPILHCLRGQETDIRKGDDALVWINTEAMRHLQSLFPDVDVLHAQTTQLQATDDNGVPQITFHERIGQFEFEAKDIYHTGTFHGSANYRLMKPGYVKTAMRSYRDHIDYYTAEIHQGRITLGTRYDYATPQEVFLASLLKPRNVTRADVFVKRDIIKPKEYVKNYEAIYKYSPLRPGDSVFKTGLLREFSLAQFTFQTAAQFKAIQRQWLSCKGRVGEYVESYFLNNDGSLDFQRMIETVDALISKGSTDLLADLKADNLRHQHKREHKTFHTLETTRAFVKKVQRFPSDSTRDEVSDNGDTASAYEDETFRFSAN